MIAIAPYSDTYKNDVLPFILNIQQNEFAVPVTAADQPDLTTIDTVYQAGNGNFWVATEDDALVGTVALLDAGDGIVILRKMFAAPAYRGAPHRLGQKLLDVALGWAAQKGFREVYLGTRDILEAAIKFYKKNGFAFIEQANLPEQVVRHKMPVDNHYYTLSLQRMEKSA